MQIKREAFLKVLESVTAGLAQREIIEQSSCFVFSDGRVSTFNDAVSVSSESPLDITGAVPSKPLLDLLSRLGEDELKIEVVEAGIQIKGKGRRATIKMEADISVFIDNVVKPPDEWTELNAEFADAVGIVQTCASKDDSSFLMTCIHITPDRLEACDFHQLAVYPMETGIDECLIRRSALVSMVGMKMTEVSVTDSWIHFRNPDGLTMSCRRWVDDYSDVVGQLDSVEEFPMTLPAGLGEAVSNAEVFSADGIDNHNVLITLEKGKIRIRGEGALGWYEERKVLKYDGRPLTFLISPKMLAEITTRTNECVIVPKDDDNDLPGKLKVDAGKFVYIACLDIVEE